jgi:hypothetical protein
MIYDTFFKPASFPHLATHFRQFKTKQFAKLIDRKRSEWINRVLLELIQKEAEPCFLLPAVLEYIRKVEDLKLLQHYSFNSFELWLNHFSNLSAEENERIRGKIAGKWIPRREYQDLFPLGLGKVYEGSHFVTAHHSPDLDTTVASFWGWVDAFAARVGSGLHVWNLPGEPSQIEIRLLFFDYFGRSIFSHLSKNRTALICTGNDLMTQQRVSRKMLHESIVGVEHDRDQHAIVVVDQEGFYLGDWRATDAEEVGQLIGLLIGCLRWFENSLIIHFTSLFAKERLMKDEVLSVLRPLYELKIQDCEPIRELTINQKRNLQHLFLHVFQMKQGLEITFEELSRALAQCNYPSFSCMEACMKRMQKAQLFHRVGTLTEKRSLLFRFLSEMIQTVHEEISLLRRHLEQFKIALAIKKDVYQHLPTFVTVRSDVEEIRAKMGTHTHLTVVYPDQGKFYPVGVIRGTDVRKNFLGSVSLRDFSNREEMMIPPYLEIISIIDHHKSAITTYTPSLALIGDVQSSNTLTAECAMQINDRYSLGGLTPIQIEQQLKQAQTEGSIALQQRLLLRKNNVARIGTRFVHPERESLEYLHFLYAILDDTDLLTKVTMRDVQVCAALLNRLRSFALEEEVEVLSIDQLLHMNSAKKAAEALLQTEEMYALYRKPYEHRERDLNHAIRLAAQHRSSDFFLDTKEQNGCCRVGQTKLFTKNISLFAKHAEALRTTWVTKAMEVHKQHPELDLHLHMISTIASAEEVFQGTTHQPKNHRDELWFWVPSSELGIEHLKNFLNVFQGVLGKGHAPLELEFPGSNAEELLQMFRESFLEIPHRIAKKKNPRLPIAILRYRAGSLNSRKAMISPCLPFVKT